MKRPEWLSDSCIEYVWVIGILAVLALTAIVIGAIYLVEFYEPGTKAPILESVFTYQLQEMVKPYLGNIVKSVLIVGFFIFLNAALAMWVDEIFFEHIEYNKIPNLVKIVIPINLASSFIGFLAMAIISVSVVIGTIDEHKVGESWVKPDTTIAIFIIALLGFFFFTSIVICLWIRTEIKIIKRRE